MRMKLLWIVSSLLWVSCVDAALVGSWSFSEGSGQWAGNDVPGGVNLRLGSSDSAWADPAWTSSGYVGNGLDFSNPGGGATPDYLRPTSAADLSAFNTGTFTVDAWINLDSIPLSTFDSSNPYRIISFGGENGSAANKAAYFLRITRRADGAGILGGYFFDENEEGHSIIHSASLEAGTWYHVGFSHDGSAAIDNTTLWVDGVSKVSSFSAHPRTDLAIDGASLVVGAQYVAQARGFDGQIDELKIYNSVEPRA